ncbi:MAG: hypothetical protein R8K20_09980 [Gallionellaceae bacterium]
MFASFIVALLVRPIPEKYTRGYLLANHLHQRRIFEAANGVMHGFDSCEATSPCQTTAL